MKIVVEDSCFGRTLMVDDQNFNGLPVMEQNYILCSIFNKLYSDRDQLNLTLDMVALLDPEECEFLDEPCDQCGHYFSNDTYEI